MSADFSNGLFGCFGDFKLCIITYFAPCYTFGKINEALGESCLKAGIFYFVPFLNCYSVITTRGKVRDSKEIAGSLGKDILMHCFCHPCALVQEAKEVGVQGPAENEMERA